MKKFYTFTLALVVLLLMTAIVSADSGSNPTRIFYQNGRGVDAYWVTPNVGGGTYLTVFSNNGGDTQITFDTWGYDANGNYYEYYTAGPDGYQGSVTIPDNTFKIDNVKSASLTNVQIPVIDSYTRETKTVTINVEWIGTGDATKEHFMNNGGSYLVKGNGVIRDATATGSLSGAVVTDLGPQVYYAVLGWINELEIVKNNK